ncbi:MAG: VTT domain-containing protein [Firmicutes bacterium]|nr:VTT domain-containing protein [Bacillota bacterium]
MDDQPVHKHHTILWTVLAVAVGILATVLYFRYEHDASAFIRSLGPWGVLAAIVLMALLCIIPFPAEFLMVVDMQIYGVWAGILYVWIGAMVGSVATFLLAKWFGERLVVHFVKAEHLHKLTRQVEHGGPLNLLFARLIPFIPFVVFNYACGLIPRVRLWTYLWTTGLGIIPYDFGAALLFLGFSSKILVWLIAGGVALAVIWAITLFVRHRLARGTAQPSRDGKIAMIHSRRRHRSPT